MNPARMACSMGTVLVAIGTVLASEATAGEPGYPNKPVRWVVPYAAGGPTDLVARLVGQKLAERWGQQIVVDIRPGANSIIGSEIVARAAPDGYTLLVALPAFAINPSVYRKLPYHTESDFKPVIQIASAPYLVLANPALPARSIRELVALAKARPGQLSFGSGGTASPAHLAMELLSLQARVRMEHVPYKGGAPALTDLMTGEIQALINPALSAMPFVKAGRLRILAVTSAKRSSLLPEVPTVAESGLPSYEVTTWYGLFAPGKTPAPVVQKVNADVAQVLRDPGIRKRLGELDAAPVASSPEEFSGFVREEIAKWGGVVRKAGIRIQ